MGWALVARKGKQGNAKALAAAGVLRALFGSDGHGGARQRGGNSKPGGAAQDTRWTCEQCAFSNFGWRRKCFKCTGKSKPAGADQKPPRATAPPHPRDPAQPSAEPPPARRPAPEVSTAEAEAKAAALEASAVHLRTAGLETKATELEQEAVELRKRAAGAPTPGKRLDTLEAFLKRAEGRLAKADENVKQAETGLRTAQATKEAPKKN